MSQSSKPIVRARLCGGLGNQLFIYATAYALAARNNAQLSLDTVSGFTHDPYQRSYMLDNFNITGRKLKAKECLPTDRFQLKRRFLKAKALLQKKENHSFIFEYKKAFDEDLIHFQIDRSIWLEGLWQSELYFYDFKQDIKQEFEVQCEISDESKRIAEIIRGTYNSVCVHVRRYNDIPYAAQETSPAVGVQYYQDAISLLTSKVKVGKLFCFGDEPEWIQSSNLGNGLPAEVITHTHQFGDHGAIEDQWLMRQCNHFIIPNSTFSWWAAWLGEQQNTSRVIAPTDSHWFNRNTVCKHWTPLQNS